MKKRCEWHGGVRKQSDQCSLLDRLSLDSRYTRRHESGLSISFIKIGDRLDSRLQRKGGFLDAHEAWNHLVSVGITQANKPWVGILILGKHLSLERKSAGKLLLTHSLFLTLSSMLHQTSSDFPLVVGFFPLHFFPIWYDPVMCFHVSVNICWVHNILYPQKWNSGLNPRGLFLSPIMKT